MLLDDLHRLCRLENENPGMLSEQIKTVKSKIADLEVEKYKGAIVRARAAKYILGEQPTKRALSAEAKHVKEKNIAEIEYEGLPSSQPEIIEKAFIEYYSNLFQRQKHGSDAQFEKYLVVMPHLEEEITEKLEEPISVAEIEKAIEELATKKAPGPDGLTAAFYKKFKHDIAARLHDVITESNEAEKLPPSFLNTHTVLIPKVDDAHKLRNVKNYRPIALGNVDYKVLMKVLARRLQNVICDIVVRCST